MQVPRSVMQVPGSVMQVQKSVMQVASAGMPLPWVCHASTQHCSDNASNVEDATHNNNKHYYMFQSEPALE